MSPLPIQPSALRARINVAFEPPDLYEDSGRSARDDIVALLPDAWDFRGKRALDFGCGAGRVLRHFLPEAEVGDFYGCDIDAPSIEWLNQYLNPPFKGAVAQEAPPLPYGDASFDLVWAASVFTHLSDLWSAWLLELHRVLAEDGVLIASFLGPGADHGIGGVEWSEHETGMNVLRYGQTWDRGGPIVLHSQWWIRAHWGRAFEIGAVWTSGFGYPEDRSRGHGIVVARKRAVELVAADLEWLDDDPREIAALHSNIRQLHHESSTFRGLAYDLERERDFLRSVIDAEHKTLSWRVTAPLRRLRRLARP